MRAWYVWATLLVAYGDGKREDLSWTFYDHDAAERFLLFIRQDSRTVVSGMY